MMKQVKDLMARQLEERKETGVSIINNTFEALKLLGQENLLEQKVVEVEKVVKVEIPTEIDNKELEDLKVTNSELEALIKGLKKELSNEKRKSTNSTKKVDKLKEQVAELESDVKGLSKIVDRNKELEKENKHYKDVIAKLEAKLNAKKTAEFKVPVDNKQQAIKKQEKVIISKDLELYLNNTTRILGKYKDVIFEASKRMDAITVYNPNKYDMKEEINAALESANLFAQARDVKDQDRIETENGSCHMIEKDKYMGFIVYKGQIFCYVYNDKYERAKCILLNKRLNDVNIKFDVAKDEQQTIINSLVAQHKAVSDNRIKSLYEDVYKGLGLDFLEEGQQESAVTSNNNIPTPSFNLNLNKAQAEVATESNINNDEEVDMVAEFARMLAANV